VSYKTILVHVDESTHAPERIKLAADIARRCDAHLAGVAATALPGTYYLAGVLGESSVTLSAYLEYMRERAEASLAVFEATGAQAGVTSLEKRVIEDEGGAAVSMQARYSDLVVIGQADPEESLPALRRDFPAYVVLNAGRPVLIVPYAGQFESVGKRVIVAWDASMEAARAVSGALPLLQQADIVRVVVFNSKSGLEAHGEQPGTDLALYLTRHGVRVELSQQPAPTGGTVGDALLAHAAHFNADLLVMGAYGHSRFREVLLGGVTHTVLDSMTIPVLMSH
jgi:nucleotide-binding universal stress UspA family protein